MDPHMHSARPSPSVFKNKDKKMVADDDSFEDEEDEEESGGDQVELEESGLGEKKKLSLVGGSRKRESIAGGGSAGGGGVASASCQVERCGADLTQSKRYYKRHKVCEVHAKAPMVMVCGLRQRFCQQCSRFHDLSEFDDAKRSCRRRLAGHNKRRRKSSHGSRGESSSPRVADSQLQENQCRQVDERGRAPIALPGAAPYKNFHIH